MSEFTYCPKCTVLLELDGHCSACLWKPSQPIVAPSKGKAGHTSLAGQLCAWNDHGAACRARGIVSNGTDGSAPWYCRDHWADLQGHERPKPPKDWRNEPATYDPAKDSESLGVRQWHQQMRVYLGKGDVKIGREPGCDDGELSDS